MPPRNLLVWLLTIGISGCGVQTAEDHLRQGKDFLANRDRQSAIIELKSVLQEQPANAEARLLLGKAYLEDGAFANAAKELAEAREKGAAEEQVLPLLAKATLALGKPQETLDLGVPAQAFGPQSLAILHAARASAQLGLGQQKEAEQSMLAAEKADPEHPDLLLLKARVALTQHDEAQALALVDTVLKQDAKSHEALYLKALILAWHAKVDEALRAYQQIIAYDARQYRAHLGIANLLIEKGDLEGADKAIKAAEATGQSAMVHYTRATLEIRQGKFEKALSAITNVLKVAPEHPPSLLAHAYVSAILGNREQAIKSAGKVIAFAPGNLLAARIIASSQIKNGNIEGALSTLRPILENKSIDTSLLVLGAEAYLRAENYSRAMELLDRAAALDPKDPAIKTNLALSQFAAGDNQKALESLEKAVRMSDAAGQADFAMVMLHLKSKSFDRALQAISQLENKLPQNPITHNLRAAALLGKKDRAGARNSLERALTLKRDFLPAVIGLARMDQEDHQPASARKRLESVLATDSKNLVALMALADLSAGHQDDREFVNWLEKAAKAQPKAIQPWQKLVEHHLRKGNAQRAQATAKAAYNTHPDNPGFINLLGTAQMAMGDMNGAIRTYTRLAEIEPDSPDAMTKLAVVQATNDQLRDARTNLEQALRVKPDHLPALDTLLRVELVEKQVEAALRIARRMQSRHPSSPIGFDREGDILLAQKQAAPAVQAYEHALQRHSDPNLVLKIYRAHLLAGDSKSAQKRLSDWLRAHPDDEGMRLFAASQLMKAGQNLEAMAAYEGLLRISPSHLVALNNLAMLYQREKDGRALATAERALKLAPSNPAIQDTLGWILVERGQLVRGLELLRSATDLAPGNSNIRYHYGAALAKAGRRTEAIKELEASLASGQNSPETSNARALLNTLR